MNYQFEKDRWYSDGKDYYQYLKTDHSKVFGALMHTFRKAGEKAGGQYDDDAYFGTTLNWLSTFQPANLVPDFTDAKAGDKCFETGIDECVIKDIHEEELSDIHTGMFMAVGKEDENCSAMWIDYPLWMGGAYADMDHPTLFNSYAQFMAYWAEYGIREEK
jgi:hypothetical protein